MSAHIKNSVSFRTAESVSPKHPDKLCDQTSDALLDAYLDGDKHSRVAIEVAGGHGKVFITGEVTSNASVDVLSIAREVTGVSDITVNIATQSNEIAAGVDTGGAGDQGIMVGYACSQTPELLPLEVVLARRLNQYLFKQWQYDGKTQVTLRSGNLVTVVASWQNVKRSDLDHAVSEWLQAEPLLEGHSAKDQVRLILNPCGDWHQGGFDADAGLTGRKLVVDNYGPRIPIGGGAFSGKDPSKVDRSAAYMARRIAVDYLKGHSDDEVYCYLAYAIGVAEPVEATVIVDGVARPVEGYDLTPAGIIKQLDLRQPIYRRTAEYGHFGHAFSWDKF